MNPSDTDGRAVRGGKRLPLAALSAALLVLLLASCGHRHDEPVDTGLTRETQLGRFTVTAVSDLDPPTINRIHTWRVTVFKDGNPVEAARILVDGGMPEHQHGLPTRPEVTENLGEGVYRVEGVKFSMPGHWKLKFSIWAEGTSDVVIFDLMIE